MFKIHIPKPLCGKCLKEVDKLEISNDFSSCKTVFIAKCHGEEDKFIMPDYLRHEISQLEKGMAFNQRKIANEKQSYLE